MTDNWGNSKDLVMYSKWMKKEVSGESGWKEVGDIPEIHGTIKWIKYVYVYRKYALWCERHKWCVQG